MPIVVEVGSSNIINWPPYLMQNHGGSLLSGQNLECFMFRSTGFLFLL